MGRTGGICPDRDVVAAGEEDSTSLMVVLGKTVTLGASGARGCSGYAGVAKAGDEEGIV